MVQRKIGRFYSFDNKRLKCEEAHLCNYLSSADEVEPGEICFARGNVFKDNRGLRSRTQVRRCSPSAGARGVAEAEGLQFANSVLTSTSM